MRGTSWDSVGFRRTLVTCPTVAFRQGCGTTWHVGLRYLLVLKVLTFLLTPLLSFLSPSFLHRLPCLPSQVRNTIPPLLLSCPHELIPIVSCSTAHRHLLRDRINRTGELAIVACQYCTKKKLACWMSSLKKECRNCYRNGVKVCVPVDVPLLDFSRLNAELARLDL
jgi:hypothetical protein